MSDPAEAQQAAPLTPAQKEAELRAAEARLDAEKADLRTKEADLRTKEADLRAKEADLRTKEADLRTKEADLRTKEADLRAEKVRLDAKEAELRAAKKAKPGRFGLPPTRATLDQAIAEAQEAVNAAKAAVDAAQIEVNTTKTAVRTAETQVDIITSLVIKAKDKVNALVNAMAPKQWVQAVTWFKTPLPPHSGRSGANVSTKFSRESITCTLARNVVLWEEFDPSKFSHSLGALKVEKPPELPALEAIYRKIDSEAGVLRMIGTVLDLILFVLKHLFPRLGFNRVRTLGTPSDVGKGGTTDDCMEIEHNGKWHVVYAAEHKRPDVQLEQSTGSSSSYLAHQFVQAQLNRGDGQQEMIMLQRNVFYTVTQMYTYMLLKGGLIYACFGNYDTWCYAMRKHDAYGNEMLLLSPYYHMDEPPARLAFAYFLYLAIATLHENGTLTLPVGTGLIEVITDTESPTPRIIPFSPTVGPAGAGAQSQVQPQGQGQVDSERHAAQDAYVPACLKVPRYEGIPVTTTTKALGAPLIFHNNSVPLAQSSKSVAFRGTVQGRDLVWRSVDLHGLPKHDKDWPLEAIEHAMENEVRVYDSLRGDWGQLVPHFVMRGPDFNFMWVTVTTYEGVSLQRLVDDEGGLTQAVKVGALRSLSQLHARGVIHGEVELRNAVWRAKDGLVLWVDLEFAMLKQDLVPNVFDKKAQKEMIGLDALLSEVATVEPRSISPTSSAETDPEQPKKKRICAVVPARCAGV